MPQLCPYIVAESHPRSCCWVSLEPESFCDSANSHRAVFLVWYLNLILGLRHHGKGADHDSRCKERERHNALWKWLVLPNITAHTFLICHRGEDGVGHRVGRWCNCDKFFKCVFSCIIK